MADYPVKSYNVTVTDMAEVQVANLEAGDPPLQSGQTFLQQVVAIPGADPEQYTTAVSNFPSTVNGNTDSGILASVNAVLHLSFTRAGSPSAPGDYVDARTSADCSRKKIKIVWKNRPFGV
jgi:hypothetical protein